MLINGIVFNNYTGYHLNEAEIKMIQSINDYLLQSLVKGYIKNQRLRKLTLTLFGPGCFDLL